MMRNCRILVPLDFADSGTYALEAAKKIAALFDGRITPFHAYIPISDLNYGADILGMNTAPSPAIDMQEIEATHREHLHDFCVNHISEEYLEEPRIAIGNPAQSITDTAEEYDLIVMSSHGRSGFSRFFMGSVSDKVLRSTHKPVLIVNKEKQLQQLNTIMLTTDLSEHSKAAFPIAKTIAKAAGSAIELVHILTFDSHARDKPEEQTANLRQERLNILAKEQLHELGDAITTKMIVSSSTPHEAILNENLNNPHDLIIMATVGRTGIDYMMMGSTTANVVRHVQSPVLSINPKEPAPSDEEA